MAIAARQHAHLLDPQLFIERGEKENFIATGIADCRSQSVGCGESEAILDGVGHGGESYQELMRASNDEERKTGNLGIELRMKRRRRPGGTEPPSLVRQPQGGGLLR